MAINKVEANGQTLIDLTSDTATADDVLEGRTLHLASGAPATGTYRPSDEIEARLKATVGHSSKNLFQITADTRTINGITFTIDKQAGTVTANGTASAYTTFGLVSPSSFYQEQGMILSGCTGGSAQTYWIDTWDGSVQIQNFSGETRITTQSWTQVRIVIRRGVSVSNLVFKPMIRDGSILDDTFEPYQTPTDEAKMDKPVELVSTATNTFTYPSVSDLKSKYSMLTITAASSQFVSVTVPTSIIFNVAESDREVIFPSVIGHVSLITKTTGIVEITGNGISFVSIIAFPK
jgi:hypothetical protein